MLYQVKFLLANHVRVAMLELRHLELQLYTSNARNLAFKAVLLGAVGWSGLVNTKKDYYALGSGAFQLLYPVACMINVGYSFLAVVQYNLIALAAPGLALRGPNGSVRIAVEGMTVEYWKAMRWLAQSVLWTLLTLLVYAWSGGFFRPMYTKLMLTGLAVASSALVYTQARSVARQFVMSEEHAGSFFYPGEHGTRDPATELLDGIDRAGAAAAGQLPPRVPARAPARHALDGRPYGRLL